MKARLNIETKRTVRVREPLVARLWIENVSDAPIHVYGALLRNHSVRVQILDPSGNPVRYKHDNIKVKILPPRTPDAFVRLYAGYCLGLADFFDGDAVLATLGEYTLVAEYKGAGFSSWAKPFNIAVETSIGSAVAKVTVVR